MPLFTLIRRKASKRSVTQQAFNFKSDKFFGGSFFTIFLRARRGCRGARAQYQLLRLISRGSEIFFTLRAYEVNITGFTCVK